MIIPDLKSTEELKAYFNNELISIGFLTTNNFDSKNKTAHFLGRDAAKLALNLAGFRDPFDIKKGLKGQPLFPPGFNGSISHSNDYDSDGRSSSYSAIALVSKERKVAVDMESTNRNFSHKIIERIATPTELKYFLSRNEPMLSLALFSAKETIYKLISPNFNMTLGFQDAELQYDQENGLFYGLVRKFSNKEILIRILKYEHRLISYALI